jgi:hypothetical protein
MELVETRIHKSWIHRPAASEEIFFNYVSLYGGK